MCGPKNKLMKNAEIRAKAWSTVSSCWPKVIVATIVVLVFFLVNYCIQQFLPVTKGTAMAISAFISLLIGGPLSSFAYPMALKSLYYTSDDKVMENMFSVFFDKYYRLFKTYFLEQIIVALGMLLLIVPGIILGLAYSMTPFILADDGELSTIAALKKSRVMMKGHKMDLFLLLLSFIGWYALVIITLGIAALWVVPYVKTAEAAFYEDIKNPSETIE